MAGGVLCVCVGFYVRVVSSLFLFFDICYSIVS